MLMDMSEPRRPSLEIRVTALEWEMRQLRAELIRAKTAGERPTSPMPPFPPVVEAGLPEAPPPPSSETPGPSLEPRRSPAAAVAPGVDLETLVGRYGMLGLATMLALAALGTFVSWAIAHGLLGPTTRVVLGLVAAAAIGVAGLKLRPRSRSFGDTLLALALAAVHVCAWAAGPSMGLVPAPLALGCSAAASVALGAFALIEADEPLWCVGFGGACIAPFVTSTGQGTAPMPASQNAPLFALGLPLVVAGFAVLPFARGQVLRPRLRTMGLLAAGAAFRLAFGPLPWMGPTGAAIGIGIAGCALLVLLELADGEPAGKLLDGFGETEDGPAAWVEGAVLPGLFLGALGVALDLDAGPAFGAAAVILFASAARRSEASRDALAASTWAAAMVATWLTTRSADTLAIASLAWGSILLVWLGRWVPTPTWSWTSRISLTMAGLWALSLLSMRPPYETFPFASRESIAAFAVALAWAAALYDARTNADERSRNSARVGLVAFAFLWGHQELVHAISPSTSSLLLVGYYAISSVAFVGWGRARRSPGLRRVGLGLGLVAAFLAARGAWQLDAPGTRIAAYLVVSGFLLGIAWWYRQPDEAPLAQTIH